MADVINDDEILHRRVHYKQVKPGGAVSSAAFKGEWHFQISSAAFKDPDLSVDRACLRSAPETQMNSEIHGVAQICAGFPRGLGLQVNHDPQPENLAHALILGKKTDTIARTLAREAKWVLPVPCLGNGNS